MEKVRRNMGYTLRYSRKIDLINMEPQNDLSSSGYCLARKGREYLIYVPSANQVEADLRDAKTIFDVEWFDPGTGKQVAGDPVEGGKKIVFNSPFQSNE